MKPSAGWTTYGTGRVAFLLVSGRRLSDMNDSGDAIGPVEKRAQHSTAKIQKAKLARFMSRQKFNRVVEFLS
jgi:hypothetical protein